MEFTIEFGGDPQEVTITLAGVATPEEFRRYNEERASDPRFRAGMTMLVDISALDTSQLSNDDLQALSGPMVERDLNHPPLAVAILAPNAQTFADAMHHRAHLGGASSRRGVFASRAAALDWLSEQRRSE
jgi:hypothetical protein